MTQTVALEQMLAARERRVAHQQELQRRFNKPLICFTMNIAGPVKNSAQIRRGFDLGNALLQRRLAAAKTEPLYFAQLHEPTGNEAFYVVDLPPALLKQITTDLEDSTPAGRLFDMDVLLPGGEKVERQTLGLPERRCLLCGGPAKACARSRTHTVAELQEKTNALLSKAVADADAKTVAKYAVQALLYEVCTTPKPGLVDRDNSGSHRDMDVFTFMASASSLWPYFEECCKIGIATAENPATDTLAALRAPGRTAEAEMLFSTGGVNTHKGAIFSMGLACAALGRLPRTAWKSPERALQMCAEMAAGVVAADFAGITAETARTAGQKYYVEYGITGVRGQAEAGFPAVLQAGLPTLENALLAGHSLNDAGAAALLALMAAAVDTNLITRGGLAAQRSAAAQAAKILRQTPCPNRETLAQLDAEFIQKNLSPGGSADLLALCYLLYFLGQEGA